jgi:hypothetical protein
LREVGGYGCPPVRVYAQYMHVRHQIIVLLYS